MSLVRRTTDVCYWDGGYSRCCVGGAIERYVQEKLGQFDPSVSFVFVRSDGLVGRKEYDRICTEYGRTPDALVPEETVQGDGVLCLCSRNTSRQSILLPLDDQAFEIGVEATLASFPKPAWEDREPIAFWRGGASGFDRPSLRHRVAQCLAGHPHSDVRITPWGGWEGGQTIPVELFAPRCSLQDHFRYKYLLIVDGNCIASNLQWVFASGAVPILVTHPSNQYWFKGDLLPMIHYVPVKYDLSDLRERIEWLVTHDAEAKTIAERAQLFARQSMSPEGQRRSIDAGLMTWAQNRTQTASTLADEQRAH